jgi:2,3-bisphosphoglycerate-independent phosphoglycerate mutase
MPVPKPVILCILDGWGHRADRTANAPALAHTPAFDRVMATCPHALLTTYGPDVGLPSGQMGNSEVGHTNIGAGRVVAMDLGQIDLAIEDGSFFHATALTGFMTMLQRKGGTAHLMGVMSDGGVHGHLSHMIAATRALVTAGVPVALHLITDGRDVAPKSAYGYLEELTAALPTGVRLATLTGRYFALDRDNRWERVAEAEAVILRGQGLHAATAHAAITAGYERSETDEFITATALGDYAGARDGDGIFCLNFRADRAREILRALLEPKFAAFDVGARPEWSIAIGMTEYSDAHNAWMTPVFPARDVRNALGAWVAAHGRRQFRLAETEKYPHVTFFLNGGREEPEAGEDRHMAPSPKVATYDLAPEMSAAEVTRELIAGIGRGYDLIVVNYANPDMVGHTGNLNAAIRACEAVDAGLAQVLPALAAAGGAMIVTADHGNCEVMFDPVTGGPHTAHTLNPVPVALIGGPAGARLRDGGRLADLAPTVLHLMGLPKPPEMTGESLIA